MRLYIEVNENPMKEINVHREEEEKLLIYMSIKKRKEIRVIHKSTNFERERFLISSGDVDEQPEAEFVK
jgi:hypothetical protein